MTTRAFYELRRIRPHGFDSDDLGSFYTEEQARDAMSSWRTDPGRHGWRFRINHVSIEVIHDDSQDDSRTPASAAPSPR
jgi:hypothetical protein